MSPAQIKAVRQAAEIALSIAVRKEQIRPEWVPEMVDKVVDAASRDDKLMTGFDWECLVKETQAKYLDYAI